MLRPRQYLPPPPRHPLGTGFVDTVHNAHPSTLVSRCCAVTINADTKKIDQEVSLNGKVVSQLSDPQEMKPQIIYSANECSTDGCGTLPNFSWDNATTVLSEAKKHLGTLISYHGASSSSGLKTTDGGVTWHAGFISMRKEHRLEHPVEGSAVHQSAGRRTGA